MIFGRRQVHLETERLILRLPRRSDYRAWAKLRSQSLDFLQPWEPKRPKDFLMKKSFFNRVRHAQRVSQERRGYPFLIFRKSDAALVGGLTLDNVRHGVSQTGTIGYWIGAPYQRHGYMRESLLAVVHFAFEDLDLSRLEAGCLPENTPSRSLLEGCGFKYEGVAQSYLQINGRWRNHVLYANLRGDRRGRV